MKMETKELVRVWVEAFNRRDVDMLTAFYEEDAVTSVVRFCFAKKDATLDTALERLSDAVHRR